MQSFYTFYPRWNSKGLYNQMSFFLFSLLFLKKRRW